MSAITASPWKTGAGNTWWLVVFLAIAFASMRVVGMLGPSHLRWLVPLGFLCMAAAPWLLLTREGRRQIGLVKADAARLYLPGIVLGALGAALCFALGLTLFGTSEDNWFITIANNFRQNVPAGGLTRLQLFLVMAIPAVSFSPIGEEMFFRGLLQRTLEQRLSERSSTLIECVAFALVHLCHHGILLTATGMALLPLSAAIWVALMFLGALLFAWLRKRSGSLFPAMASHAAFNVTMTALIFAVLWERM